MSQVVQNESPCSRNVSSPLQGLIANIALGAFAYFYKTAKARHERRWVILPYDSDESDGLAEAMTL